MVVLAALRAGIGGSVPFVFALTVYNGNLIAGADSPLRMASPQNISPNGMVRIGNHWKRNE